MIVIMIRIFTHVTCLDSKSSKSSDVPSLNMIRFLKNATKEAPAQGVGVRQS